MTEYSYDAAGQLDLIEYMDGETVVSDVDYAYDDVGNRTSMIDDTGTTSYEYDDLDRLTEVEYPDTETVAYRYDNTGGMGEDPAEYPGQRTKITYPDAKTVVYTYEEDGRMATVTDWDSNVTTYTYGDSGRLDSTELPNTITTTYDYDAAGRLVELENADDTPTVLSSYDYTLDAVGNRTQMVDTVGTTTYEYDPRYQLVAVTYPNSDEATYSYDAMGNRLSLDFNETTTEYDYDAADQLTDVDMVSYSYDDNGNLTARGSDTFEWGYENRLTDAEIDSVDSSYEYNGDGLRVSRTIDTTTVDYYWDVAAGLPVVLQDSDDNSYVYGLDLIARVDDQGDEEYYLYDGLGSTTGLADDAGTVTDTYSYDVFGAIRSQTGSSANEFTYTGEQVDGTDLQFLRARYYDPAVGRFLSEDPLGIQNVYVYGANNPVMLVDPYGLLPGWDDVGDVVGKVIPDDIEDCVSDLVGCGEDIGKWIIDKAACGTIEAVTPLPCDPVLDAVDWLATQAACRLDDQFQKESYYDLSFFWSPHGVGEGVLIGGQVSCGQGLHAYAGGGAGRTGISATVGYGQQITEGAGCAVALGAKGYGGLQVGAGGLLDENQGFIEFGLQSPGATCYFVGGRLGD